MGTSPLLFSLPLRSGELTTPQGVRILQNKSFDDSEATRQEILEVYQNLRVTDVADGMDLIGLQDIGVMKREIRPLWRDTDRFSHRFFGFAVIVRHVPTDVWVGQNSFETIEEAKQWKSEQYGRAPDAWLDAVKPGDVGVVDADGVNDCGFIGSNNSLGWARNGVVGVVSNGGVLVYPGDVVVAEGDGVIVVPRKHALEVGQLAKEINTGDQQSRREKYEDLGLPLDETVRDKE